METAPAASDIGMWATFALIVAALVLYAWERVAMELTSLAFVCTPLVLFPLVLGAGAEGRNLLGATTLLAGFANPALLAVVALLVMGEALARTGALERGAGWLFEAAHGRNAVVPAQALVAVLVVSGFLNNIPVVVIFIPLMQALAERLNTTPSRFMMPLSFAAILGGMTTLVGSSANLLVMAPSNYLFADFARAGMPLMIVVWATFTLIAPLFFNL